MIRELYILPEPTEPLLAAIAAIQHHIAFKLRDQGCELAIDLVNLLPENEWLMGALVTVSEKVPIRWRSDIGYIPRGSYDLVRDMSNIDRMYEWGLPARKHLATMYGVLIGSDPEDCPDLSALVRVQPSVDVVALTGLETTPDSLKDWVFEKADGRSVATYDLNSTTVTVDQFRAVMCGKMFVGRRSALTYLAAIVGRDVVELYPKYYYKEFLHKFSRPRYSMIYGQENFTKEHVQRAMEMLWVDSTGLVTEAPSGGSGSKIPTVRTMSDVGRAGESWPAGLIRK